MLKKKKQYQKHKFAGNMMIQAHSDERSCHYKKIKSMETCKQTKRKTESKMGEPGHKRLTYKAVVDDKKKE